MILYVSIDNQQLTACYCCLTYPPHTHTHTLWPPLAYYISIQVILSEVKIKCNHKPVAKKCNITASLSLAVMASLILVSCSEIIGATCWSSTSNSSAVILSSSPNPIQSPISQHCNTRKQGNVCQGTERKYDVDIDDNIEVDNFMPTYNAIKKLPTPVAFQQRYYNSY